jgi:hypothetical protein
MDDLTDEERELILARREAEDIRWHGLPWLRSYRD